MKKRKWKCPSQQPEYRKAQYNTKRLEVISKLGGKCSCGYSDHRALQIDHVDSTGANERKVLNGIPFLNKVLKEIESGKYQVLCSNCNWIKRAETEAEQPKGKQVYES